MIDDHDPQIDLRAQWNSLGGQQRPPVVARRQDSRSTEPPAPPRPLLTAESRRPCPRCGTEQETHAVAIPPQLRIAAGGADVRWYWQPCACEDTRREQYIARRDGYEAAKRQSDADALLSGVGLDQVADMTLRRFDPHRLRGDGAAHPYAAATKWLSDVTDRARADYHDPASPPTALFFYCPGKGRGKTHLAAALAWEMQRAHALVCFLHEEAYCSRLWSIPFEHREAAIAVPGQQAWLTVLDDLGRMTPGKGGGVANVWDGLVNRRWLARRWTIITSNYTLDELIERKSISDATYSRLRQMTRGEYVYFDGDDQRLIGPRGAT